MGHCIYTVQSISYLENDTRFHPIQVSPISPTRGRSADTTTHFPIQRTKTKGILQSHTGMSGYCRDHPAYTCSLFCLSNKFLARKKRKKKRHFLSVFTALRYPPRCCWTGSSQDGSRPESKDKIQQAKGERKWGWADRGREGGY